MTEWTLLLNSTFEPLKVVSWKKAVIMVMLDKVEVVEEYDQMVRGVRLSLPLPAVIRLNRFVRRKTTIFHFSRKNLYVRDGGRCQYCGTAFDHRGLTYDHVVPRSRGADRVDQRRYLLYRMQSQKRRQDSGRGRDVAHSKAEGAYLDPPADGEPGS